MAELMLRLRFLPAACALLFILPSNAHSYIFKIVDSRFDSVARQLDRLDFENRREDIDGRKVRLLEQLAARSGNDQLKSRAAYWSVRASQMNTNAQQCIPVLIRASKLCSPEYDYDLARINYQLAGNYERIGQYLKAYRLLNSTLPVFEKYDDSYFLGNAYLLLVQLYLDINDPDNAAIALKPAKEHYKKAGMALNRVYFFYAVLASSREEKLRYYRLSSQSGGEKDFGMTVQALNEMSDIYVSMGEPDSAEACLKKAFGILKRKSPGNRLFYSLINISYINFLYAKGKYAEALRELDNELRKKDNLKGERLLADIYELMWKVNDKTGNREDAYKYLKLYLREYQNNENQIKKQEISKIRAREAIARSNDTIKLLEQEAELSKRLNYITAMLLVAVVLVGVIVFVYFYQRYKIRKMENRQLRNNLRQEALIYSMNRNNFENDIKKKECEISSSTLLLANKNEVLQQISDITRKYSEDGRIPPEYVRQVNSVIGDSLRNDDEWQRFKLHFDSVHPDFFVKLKEINDKLTENDLRLCAYINIGMRAKQIAEMLSVSPDSINTNRYRLRKKLGLQRGESLDGYLRKI